MKKRIRSIVLAILLCLTMTDIAYAKQESLPALELYLTQDGHEGNSLLAVLTDYELAEEEMIWADVYWSLDNVTFQKQSDADTQAWAVEGKKLQRICMYRNQEPLASYLNGTIDRIYVKLEVFSTLGTSTFTQTASLVRPIEGENVQYIQTAGPGILSNMLAGTRFERYAMFHMTVTENENGYMDVLPTEQPIGIMMVPEQPLPYGDAMSTLIVQYGVAWQQSEEDPYKFVATQMWPLQNEDYYFVAGNQNFCLKAEQFPENPLTHSWMAAFKWYCMVHPVPLGYETEIILEEDVKSDILSVYLPLKPTGMTRIEVEVSVDGGETWNTTGILHAEDNPVDYMPSQEDYMIHILPDEMVNNFLAQGKGTFSVRLKIVNGVLGNRFELEGREGDTYTYSQTATWVGEYVELPDDEFGEDGDGSGDNAGGGNDNVGEGGDGDEEDTEGGNEDTNEGEDNTEDDNNNFQPDNDKPSGSGGNLGNVGTDNEGTLGGVRPGIGNGSDKDETDKPSVEQPDDEIPDNEPNEQDKPSQDTPDEEPGEQDKPSQDIPDESDKPSTDKPSHEVPDDKEDESDKPSDEKTDNEPDEQDKPSTDKTDDAADVTDKPSEENPSDESSNTPNGDADLENNDESNNKPSDNTEAEGNDTPNDSRKKAVATATAMITTIAVFCGGMAVLAKTGMLRRLKKELTKKTHR